MTDLLNAPFQIRDAIDLPPDGADLVGRAARSETYPVKVTRSADETLEEVAVALQSRQAAIVTDANVQALAAAPVLAGLRERGCDVILHALPPGERSKSLDRAVELWNWLAGSDIGRRDTLLALGGGVVCDLGGWVASGFMRGIPYINLPTTLLAQVDGALGGKVAVNHRVAKNLIGAFHQPRAVVSDVSWLRTLDRRHVSAGLAECVKKAVIASPDYWAFLDASAEDLMARDEEALVTLVRAATAIKTELIGRDPYECDLRRALNFGHTIGHPLETVTGYGPLLHGEAVAFGMVAEARIAVGRGLLTHRSLDRLVDLLERLALPTRADQIPAGVDAGAVVAAMEKVRLIRAGSLRFVLPVGLGETCIADDVSPAEVHTALSDCGMT